jgi:hypothetical protein
MHPSDQENVADKPVWAAISLVREKEDLSVTPTSALD